MSVTITITNAMIAKATPMNIGTESIGEASYEKHSPEQVEVASIGIRYVAGEHSRKTRIPNYIPTNSQFAKLDTPLEEDQAFRLVPVDWSQGVSTRSNPFTSIPSHPQNHDASMERSGRAKRQSRERNTRVVPYLRRLDVPQDKNRESSTSYRLDC